jgi:hypothetical protein
MADREKSGRTGSVGTTITDAITLCERSPLVRRLDCMVAESMGHPSESGPS